MSRRLPVVGPDAGLERRGFLRLAAGSLALAALPACDSRRPREEIVPWVEAPAEPQVPGKPEYFATALTHAGAGMGVLVESHLGRPTKVEGNPDHPASLGATDTWRQAAVLGLYDPDRSRAIRRGERVASWADLRRELGPRWAALRARQGQGLRLLGGEPTSPCELALLRRLQAELPRARWHVHEPVGQANARAGGALAFGRPLLPVQRLERARVILAFDHDLLFGPAGSVRRARGFAHGRRLRAPLAAGDGARSADLGRLYVVEPVPTVTGASADHRLPLAGRLVPAAVAHLARALGVLEPDAAPSPERLDPNARGWLEVAARDLTRARSRALVTVGEAQPPEVHALVHAINAALGALGRTVELRPAPGFDRDPPPDLAALVADIDAGQVETLVLLETNPVYTAPAELRWEAALERVPVSLHLGLYRDETGRRCTWHVPRAHELESWGDCWSEDGAVALIQPLIAPLYQGWSGLELLAWLLGDERPSGHELLRAHWRAAAGSPREPAAFEGWWRDALRRGVIADAPAPVAARVDRLAVRAAWQERGSGREPAAAEVGGAGQLELRLSPDPTVWDGRYANNAWLQELPKPLSGLTWDNALNVSPATAEALGVRPEQRVRLTVLGRSVEAPVWVVPGQAAGCLALTLGYGRWGAGQVGDGRGVNAYRLRTRAYPWDLPAPQVEPLEGTWPLATPQGHDRMEGRAPVVTATLAAFQRDPLAIVSRKREEVPEHSLYPEVRQAGAPQWGMSIDLTACIGCGACTIACQAENNIPAVGKEQVQNGREMHWLRVDRYYHGPLDRPRILHQPVPCMHCEDAPCEVVCPVGATQHSTDGLNEMLYQRCVGTRFCSNNCPYKVRRFNFFSFTHGKSPVEQLAYNPDVSVRGLGVMEKCTYCVQRIRAAEREALKERRPIRDGEVVTACQAVCPTRAIVFGDAADPASRVSATKRLPHEYSLLAELNTRPRTTYLADIRNTNPELDG